MTQFILRQSPFEVLFRDFFNTESFFNNLEKSKPGYPVDIYEDAEGLKIAIAAIGLSIDDIDITIESDILKVVHSKNVANDSSREYYQRGISARAFNLGWKIGSNFEITKTSASMDKGLLTISVPKATLTTEIKVNITNG